MGNEIVHNQCGKIVEECTCDNAEVALLSEIDRHVKRGGKVFFWVCPNKCSKGVTWAHTKTTHIATCNNCGETNILINERP